MLSIYVFFSRFLVLLLLLLTEGLGLLLMDSEYNYAAEKASSLHGKPKSSSKKQLSDLKCPFENILDNFVK